MTDRANEAFSYLKCLSELLFSISQILLCTFKVVHSVFILSMVENQYRNNDGEAERVVNKRRKGILFI